MKRALIPLMAMFLLAAPVAAQERGIGDIYEDGYAALQGARVDACRRRRPLPRPHGPCERQGKAA